MSDQTRGQQGCTANGDEQSVYTRRRILELGALGVTGAALAKGAAFGEAAQAAGRRTVAGGALRVAYPSIGGNWHPHLLPSTNAEVISNTYVESLLTTDPKFRFVPVLAESFKVMEPGKRWRFVLRKGAKFSNGARITAQDVKYSIEDYLRTDSPHHIVYTWLDRVVIVNSRTVDVLAKLPTRTALAGMAFASRIIPAGAAQDANFGRHPIGSGRYVFDEFVPNDHITVNRNAGFWGSRKGSFDRIDFRQIPDDATRVAALQAREVDFITGVPVQSMGRLRSAGFNVSAVQGVRSMMVWFNTQIDGPWNDARVRRALNYAIDRNQINKAFWGGAGAPAVGPIPASVPLFNKKLPRYTYDPKKARQLLKEAGYGNGFTVDMLTPTGRFLGDSDIAQVVASGLKAVGVNVNVTTLDFSTFFGQVAAGTAQKKYGLMLYAWNNYYPDPDGGLATFDIPFLFNLGGYRNPFFESQLRNGRRPHNTGALARIYNNLQRTVWYTDPAAIFVGVLPLIYAYNKNLKNLTLYPDERINWADTARA